MYQLVSVYSLDRLIADRYQVLEILKKDGCLESLLAQDTQDSHKSKCLIKQLVGSDYITPGTLHKPRANKTAKRRLIREAEILYKLSHSPGIPQILSCFKEDEDYYLVQEFIEGKPIAEELPTGKRCGQRWSEAQCLEMLQEVLDILELIHENRAIHCNLNPNNLIRRASDGRLILIDFGAVQPVRPFPPRRKIPMTVAMGTFGYLPPEQLTSYPQPNSDLYSLGLLTIEALTGLHPGQLEVDASGKILWQDELLVAVSEELVTIVNRMVVNQYQKRYQSVAEVKEAIASLLSPEEQYLTLDATDVDRVSSMVEVGVEEPTGIDEITGETTGTTETDDSYQSILVEKIASEEYSDSENPVTETAPIAETPEPVTNQAVEVGVEEPTGTDEIRAETTETTETDDSHQSILVEKIASQEYSENQVTETAPIAETPEPDTNQAIEISSLNESTSSDSLESDRCEVESENFADRIIHLPGLKSVIKKKPSFLVTFAIASTIVNAWVSCVGLFHLFRIIPSDLGLEAFNEAQELYQAGDLSEAIALAKSVRWDSSAYQQAQSALEDWQIQSEKAAAQFQVIETAWEEERWVDVLTLAADMPAISYWQDRIAPLIDLAAAKVDPEAQGFLQQGYEHARQKNFAAAIETLQKIPYGTPAYEAASAKISEYEEKQRIKLETQAYQLLKQAYERAIVRDFAGALQLLEKIPEGTPTHARVQEKIAEYQSKRRIKANSLLQKAYDYAGVKDYAAAIKLLKQVPSETPAYDVAQTKIAEYTVILQYRWSSKPRKQARHLRSYQTAMPIAIANPYNFNPGDYLQQVNI